TSPTCSSTVTTPRRSAATPRPCSWTCSPSSALYHRRPQRQRCVLLDLLDPADVARLRRRIAHFIAQVGVDAPAQRREEPDATVHLQLAARRLQRHLVVVAIGVAQQDVLGV